MTNQPPSALLRNARLVLADRTTDPTTLLIEAGRIAAISPAPDSSSVPVVDLAGQTLFPGFIDAHIHGAAGVDTMDADAQQLRKVSKCLARLGVTAWLPTMVPAKQEEYGRSVRAIDEAMAAADDLASPEARILGVHYEGPFVNQHQCGALHREHFRTYQTVEDLISLPVIDRRDAIHMMTLAPEVQGGVELITELTKRRWVVSIGHTKADTEILDAAFAAGARHMTHFMNAMTPLHHRTLGAAGWGLTQDDVTFDLIADGIHISREILKLIVHSKTAEKVSLISDAIAAALLSDGDYQIWGETIQVRDGRTQNAGGSIAGSVITMFDAVRLMLSLGFSESEVARMASLNPARLLGIDDECGSIQVGKRADLVALEGEFVGPTFINGRILLDQS
jgi:N-acetylglucosamine-6-phosphate deacetylase